MEKAIYRSRYDLADRIRGERVSKKTESSIKEAFVQLLDEKPLSKITVRDIVERCGINRNSFYYHYQDIPTLVEELVTEQVDRIMAEYPSVDSIETAMTAVVDFAEKNRRAVMHIYRSASRDIFELHLWRVCEYVVRSFWEHIAAGKPVSENDREIITRFYRAQCFGLVMEWMSADMKDDDIRGKIHRFCELRVGSVDEMLRRSLET